MKQIANIQDALQYGRTYLTEHGIDNAGLDSALLLMKVCGISKVELYTNPNVPISGEMLAEYKRLLTLRGKYMPTQYILGECEFYALPFTVNEYVLIPRPDTETLVEGAIAVIKREDLRHGLEIGLGSGCISVTLCHECRNLRMTGAEISPDALKMARQNARLNGVEERVDFILSNLFENVTSPPYDFIISNPPYITADEMKELAPNVAQYEPHLALLGGTDGLDFYRKITADAAKYLRKGGWLFYEIGCTQSEDVEEILKNKDFNEIETKNDLAGLPRVVMGKLS